MRKENFLILLSAFALSSCVELPKDKTTSNDDSVQEEQAVSPRLKSLSVSGNQIIIKGINLLNVKDVKLKQSVNVYDLRIESKTRDSIVTSVKPGVKLAINALSTLFVSNAYGQSSLPITFILNDNSVTTTKIADGAVTADKISDMGAVTGQALIFNGSTWAPSNLSGLNFMGEYTPIASNPPSLTPDDGDFYIVNANTGNLDIDGGGNTASTSYVIGDWVIYSLASNSWVKVSSIASGNFWQKSSDDLYYPYGDISVGTSDKNAVLTVAEEGMLGTNNGDLINIDGTDNNPGKWARTMSFGFNDDKQVYIGAYGDTSVGSSDLDHFFISVNGSSATPWSDGHFAITSVGDVGIGVTSPTSKLEVNGTVTATSFVGDGSQLTGITNIEGLEANSNIVIQANSSATGGEIQFQNNGNTLGVIDQSGNFVLGHTAALRQFDMRSPSSAEGQFVSYGNSTSSFTLASNSGSNAGSGEANTSALVDTGQLNFAGYSNGAFYNAAYIKSTATEVWSNTVAGANLSFFTTENGGKTTAEKMRITHDGNVGIGVSAPTEKLEVDGRVKLGDHIQGAGIWYTKFSGGTNDWFAGVGGSNNFRIYNGTNLFSISDDGSVGIGTIAPDDALDVIGDIDTTGCFQTNNSTTVGGTCVSDERLKENIISLENSLDKILSLNPVEYDWKDGFSDIHKKSGHEVGLIAQEVERVFPEMVIEKEDGYKRVEYGVSMKLYLISAIKEFFNLFNDKAMETDRKIASLEAENKKLKDRNEKMEEFLCSKFDDADFCTRND